MLPPICSVNALAMESPSPVEPEEASLYCIEAVEEASDQYLIQFIRVIGKCDHSVFIESDLQVSVAVLCPNEKADKGGCQKADHHGVYRKHGIQGRSLVSILLHGDILHDFHKETKSDHTDDAQPEKSVLFQFRKIRT